MSDARTQRATEIQESIRQVLYCEWDPIGVCGYGPDDEYDSYIDPIYRLLASTRSEDEIIEFLYRTERDTIGLSCDTPERLRPIAKELLAIDVSLK